MSYYFAIIGTQDNPLFEHEFGTSKQGGDGQSRFTDQARHLNQFILHSALDVVEEVQWNNGQLYVQTSPPGQQPLPSSHITWASPRPVLHGHLYMPSEPWLTLPSPRRAGTSR